MPTGLNERFILAEDEALKRKLSGLKVTWPNEKDVKVFFRWPQETEVSAARPFITIDLVDVEKASHREHQGGPMELRYLPYGYNPDVPIETGVPVADDWPTPYDLIYSVTTWTSDPRHDRQLMARMLGDLALVPHRWGYLEIPDDETVRRLETISINDFTGRDDNGDVEFRRQFVLRVESELFTAFVKDVLIPGRLVLELTDTVSGLTETIETDYTLYPDH